MSHSTIHVVAKITALPHQVEGTKELLLGLLEPTRQEKGCIKYDLFQNQDDPTDFTFVEEWQDRESLNQHLQTHHIQHALSLIPALMVAPPDIRVYNQI
ncbi:MAG: hypothetical protein N5P05_002528 [Chroococcopsis gigantea SAG 12.99]|jgi:quinol monooxygenase YgiN|nr:hypothetical protein [Chroococcopsis gigantea SAG 12.99]